MPRSLHVRLDATAEDALNIVRSAVGGSDSSAVRLALREAALRRQRRTSLRTETQALQADEQNADEMRVIREQMARLAPHPSD